MNHDDRPYYSLLKYLRTTDCIDDAEWYQLNLTIHNNEGLWLYPFISLFAGGNWAKDFLLSLPLDLKKTSNPAYLDSNLIATDVTFSLGSEAQGWEAIESISFKVVEYESNTLTWTLPFGTSSPSGPSFGWSYQLQHACPIDVSINWPAYFQRTVQGGYRGILRGNDSQGKQVYSHNVVGEFSMMHEVATQYSMTFSDDSYEFQKYEKTINDALKLFHIERTVTQITAGRDTTHHGTVHHGTGHHGMVHHSTTTVGGAGKGEVQEVSVKSYVKPFKLQHETEEDIEGFQFPTLLKNFKNYVHVLSDELETIIDENTKLHNVGFILEKTLSKVFLKEISGIHPLEQITTYFWWPFAEQSFSVDNLRVVLHGTDTLEFGELIIQLSGSMKDFTPAVPFRLSAGLSEQKGTFEIGIFPNLDGKLTIQNVLDVIDMSTTFDVSKTFPSISDISNAFCISNASVGWRLGYRWNEGIVKSLRLGLDINTWEIVSGKFMIKDLSVDISATFPNGSKRFSLWGEGIIQIGDVELQVILDIELDRVAFQLMMLESPLTLASVFGHFLGESDTTALLPQEFVSMLEQTGIESVNVEGLYDGGWLVSRFEITTTITMKLIDISDKFSLSSPRLIVDVAYPFTKVKRIINGAISAAIEVTGIPCDALVSWTGENSSITVAFNPSKEPLSLQALIFLFIEEKTMLSVPPSLLFLLGIGLANAKLTLTRSSGKLILAQMSATIVSSTSLQLWDGLQLVNLKLHLDFSNLPDSHNFVTFSASLLAIKANLNFTLSYGGYNELVPAHEFEIMNAQPPPDDITPSNNETWLAAVAYDGTISVVDIMSSVSGIDLDSELASVGFSALRGVIDFNLSKLVLTLSRGLEETSFTFNANVKYLFFDGPVHLKCAKSASWRYTFMFGISSVDFLSSFGIDNIALNDSTITLTNELVTSPLVETTTGSLNIIFRGTLKFMGQLNQLEKATDCPELIIMGSVSDSSFILAASTKEITLFDDMTLTGSLFFYFIEGNRKVTIEGRVSNIYFPAISSEKFSTNFSLFVNFPFPELGLGFSVNQMKNAFQIEGLEFKDVLFSAAFQEFPVPSMVKMEGKVWFTVDDQHFYGSVAIHFHEFNLKQSGAKGCFTTCPSVNQALKQFDSVGRSAPTVVDGTFVDFEFSLAPQNIGVIGNTSFIPQGIKLKGSLKLPSIGFDALFDINISPSYVHIMGNIEHAISVIVSDHQLFSLTHASIQECGPSLDLEVDINTLSTATCHFSGEIHLLGLSAAAILDLTATGLDFHGTMSNWQGGTKVDLTIDEKYLNLSAHFTLDVSISAFSIGEVEIKSIQVVKSAVSLTTKVVWKKITWALVITSNLTLVDWDLGDAVSFTLDANFSDFTKITDFLRNQVDTGFSQRFKDKIQDELDWSRDVVPELQKIGLEAETTTKLLVKEFHRTTESVMKTVKKTFGLSEESALALMEDLKVTAQDMGRVLKYVYGMDDKDVLPILTNAGYNILDIGRVLKNDFFVDKFTDAFLILVKARFGPIDIGRILRSQYYCTKDQITALFNSNGVSGDDTAKMLKDVYSVKGVELSKLFTAAGYSDPIIATVLSVVFELSNDDITSILVDLGLSASLIANALKEGLDLEAKVISALLKAVDFVIKEIANVLKELFDFVEQEISDILVEIGFDEDEVESVISDIFSVVWIIL